MRYILVFLLTFFFLSLSACSRSEQSGTPGAVATPSAAPSVTPANLTANDLKQLRWIEGSWKGTGDVEKPFYERYRFENDSTLLVDSFPDETLSQVEDTTRFELKDGHFGNTGETRWVATNLDDKSITFDPVAKAKNTFRWQYESADRWTAILSVPSADGVKEERVYRMERIPAK